MWETLKGQTKKSDALELEIQKFKRFLMWVLGTKLGFSGRTESVLNHQAISPAPVLLYFYKYFFFLLRFSF